MTSPLFTKRHHYNLRNKSTIVFQKCNLNNRQSLLLTHSALQTDVVPLTERNLQHLLANR